jgi:hypothetical protein
VKLLVEFTYLQVLDVLTTVAFLMQGVAEANPIVNWAMDSGPSPVMGLVMLKLAAFCLALVCFAQARHKLLQKVNVFFAALVAWNLFALILASPIFQG